MDDTRKMSAGSSPLDARRTQLARYSAIARSRLDLRSRSLTRAFAELKAGYYRRLWATTAAEVGATLEDLGGGFARIERDGVWTMVRGPEVMLDSHLLLAFAGDKWVSQAFLARGGLPVPRCVLYDPADPSGAVGLLEHSGRVVVKPRSGTGAGMGIVTNITDESSLHDAARRALGWSDQVLVEEHIELPSFRLLYLDGELLDAVRRDPPGVVGDGSRSIRSLVGVENEARLAAEQDPISLNPLTIDAELRSTLARSGLGLRSRPPKGQRVVLKSAVNQNSRQQNHVVTDTVHPYYADLGRSLLEMCGIRLLGLDLLSDTVSVPLAESGGVVNELNTTPALHHHTLVANRGSSPVPGLILESMLRVRSS